MSRDSTKSAPSMASRRKWKSCIASNSSTMSSSPESRTLGTDGVDDRGGGTDEASEGEVAGAGKGSASEGLELRGPSAAAGAIAGNDPGARWQEPLARVRPGAEAALVRAGVRRQPAGAPPRRQWVARRRRRGRCDGGAGRRDGGATGAAMAAATTAGAGGARSRARGSVESH